MPILTVEKLEKFYGAKPILKSVDFQLDFGEKAGLVGKNGSGKTTILQILAGRLEKDGGSFTFAKDATIGYLTQELEFSKDQTVWETLRSLFSHLDQMQEELRTLEQSMAEYGPEDKEHLEPLLCRYAELQETFEHAGGFRIDSNIQGVLNGLGLSEALWHQSPASFSGGERTRVALARLLLFHPNILLLDEPTNYLDIKAVQWLENYLREYNGAVLMVSHDRYFLDRVVGKIFALRDGMVDEYRGNYTRYRELWNERRRHDMLAYQEQQREIARKEKFIRESRATEKSKRQAKSIEKRLSKVERVEQPTTEAQLHSLNLSVEGRVSSVVLTASEVSKGFAAKKLLDKVSFQVRGGEKIVIMGANGTGKSTLFRMLVGEEPVDSGEITWGHGVMLGYFSQLMQMMDLSGTVYDQIMATSDLSPTQVRNFLGAFLFRGDDVFLPVSDLSGGEQRRLALAKLVLSSSNLLLLDEPTNHLDLPSLDVLEEALDEYAGTVLVITHDRYLARRLGQRLWVLVEGKLKEFNDFDAYEAWVADEEERKVEEKRMSRRSDQERRRQTGPNPEEKRRRKELERLESELQRLEDQKNEIMAMLSQPEIYGDFEAAKLWGDKLRETEIALDDVYDQWMGLVEAL